MIRRSVLIAVALSVVATLSLSAAGAADETAAAAAPATVTIMMADRATAALNTDAPVFKEIERRTGVTIRFELVPGSDYIQKRRTIIATDEVPDLLSVGVADIRDFGDSGVFLPLNDMIEKQIPNLKALLQLEWNLDVWKTAIDGTLYAFPLLKHVEFHRGIIGAIRTDTLKKLGLAMPRSFDEIYTVLRAIKQDDPNAHPWTNRGGSNNLLNCVAYAWGTGNGIYFDKDLNAYVYGSVTDRYMDLLGYFRKAYQEGILDPDFLTLTATQWREKLGSGKSYFMYDNPTFAKRANDDMAAKMPGAWFEPIPVPQNPYGGRRSLFYERNQWAGWVIGHHSKNADAIARLMNFMYSSEGAILKVFGLEGVHHEVVNGEHRNKESFFQQYANPAGGYRIDAIETDIGVGAYGDFNPYIDMRIYRLTWPEYQINWYLEMEKDSAWSDPVNPLPPPWNAEERRRLGELETRVDTILTQAIDKILLGDLPLLEYTKTMEEAKRAGATEIEKIYNDALARYYASRR